MYYITVFTRCIAMYTNPGINMISNLLYVCPQLENRNTRRNLCDRLSTIIMIRLSAILCGTLRRRAARVLLRFNFHCDLIRYIQIAVDDCNYLLTVATACYRAQKRYTTLSAAGPRVSLQCARNNMYFGFRFPDRLYTFSHRLLHR